MKKKSGLSKTAAAILPTVYGTFQLFVYTSYPDGREHTILLMKGNHEEEYLTRIHSQCLTGDTLLSLRCDCGEQLRKSMELISKGRQGVIIYLSQEGRGIGLTNKIKAYALQDKGYDTVEANEQLGFPADVRQYKTAADILKDLGILKVCLLTNNPDKEKQLSAFGIEIVNTISLEVKPNKINKRYLATKKQKLSHRLKLV